MAKKPNKHQLPGHLIMDGVETYTPCDWIVYDLKNFEHESLNVIDSEVKLKKGNNWLRFIDCNSKTLESLKTKFDIHPLCLEEIQQGSQRPKIEEFKDYIFISIPLIEGYKEEAVVINNINILLYKDTILTFEKSSTSQVQVIQDRLKNCFGRIRERGVDYLLFSTLDVIIDDYLVSQQNLDEEIELLEDQVIADPSDHHLQKVNEYKKKVIEKKKFVFSLREIIRRLEASPDSLISAKTHPYLRQLYDHSVLLAENIESSREVLSGIRDIHMAIVSNKMNEVMKILTIIATIFIPLTFIAGIYGMNFEYMPELKWKYGYFIVWGAIILIGNMMVQFFRRKKWL